MNETTAFELTGSTLAIVEQLAKDENVTAAQALALIIDRASDRISRGTLLGGQDGSDLIGDLWEGPSALHPVKTIRVATTDDLSEAADLVNEVRSAWDETPEAEDGGFASYEHEETSHALNDLERVAEGTSDDHDLSWQPTFPNGDELHLFLSV